MASSSYFGDFITPSDRHPSHRHRSPSRPKSPSYHPSSPPRSIFNLSSYTRRGRPSHRRPRKSFLRSATKQLRRLVRDLTHYAKRHPFKVLVLIVVPLLGSLTALLARMGLRVPVFLERMIALAARAAGGDPFGAVADAVRLVGGGHGDGSGRGM